MTGQVLDEILFPDLPVIDTHHHLFDKAGDQVFAILGTRRFLIDEYAEYVSDGHNVVASVIVDSRAMYRAQGPKLFRVVGETEFFNGQAAMGASGLYGPCLMGAAIVGFADLRLGDGVRPLLEAHVEAAPGRFKGIRHEGMWDADPGVLGGLFDTTEQMYLSDDYAAGLRHLVVLDLTFDAFLLAPQLGDMIAIARRFPDLRIICNHLGSPVGIGPHAGRLPEQYGAWLRDMQALAQCPNVTVKLGGLGSFLLGSDFYRAAQPPKAQRLVEEWKPYVEPVVEAFGAARCMFESNVPTDGAGSFRNVCNAFKMMTTGCSEAERRDIFAGTAVRTYRLDVPALELSGG